MVLDFHQDLSSGSIQESEIFSVGWPRVSRSMVELLVPLPLLLLLRLKRKGKMGAILFGLLSVNLLLLLLYHTFLGIDIFFYTSQKLRKVSREPLEEEKIKIVSMQPPFQG